MVISTSRTGATIISTKTNAQNDKRGSEDERMAEVRWVYFAPALSATSVRKVNPARMPP